MVKGVVGTGCNIRSMYMCVHEFVLTDEDRHMCVHRYLCTSATFAGLWWGQVAYQQTVSAVYARLSSITIFRPFAFIKEVRELMLDPSEGAMVRIHILNRS